MIVIDDKIVSDDIIEYHFVCDLNACKGACCVAGDFGAPLEKEETDILESIYDKVKPYLTPEGIEAIERDKTWVYDKSENRYSTALRSDGGCAFIRHENGIALCGIEKAWKEGVVDFQKPVSCHLYPIRITRHNQFDAVNYERWSICNAACKNGKKLKVPIYKFVKDGLIRKYGKDFYTALEQYAEQQEK